MKPFFLGVLIVLMSVPAARAQQSATTAVDTVDCAPTVDLASMEFTAQTVGADSTSRALTAAERRVQDIIGEDGVHVVHFWAPWCANSLAELENGWYALIEDNDEVTFTFVTIWNDGRSGRDALARFAVPDRVEELQLPDFGPSDDESQRRRMFLGRPLTWIPSTWIFRDNGTLAFSLNYGEMSIETLQTLIDAAKSEWSHDG